MIKYKSKEERQRRSILNRLLMFLLFILVIATMARCALHTDVEIVTNAIPVEAKYIEAVAPVTDVRYEEHVKLQYGFTEKEIYLLAQLLCGSKDVSGDGEYDFDFMEEIDYAEVGKVLCVTMNRVNSNKFPDTVKEVVLSDNQFSVMPKNLKKTPSEKALKVVREWCGAYDHYAPGIQSIPTNHIYFNGNGKTNTTRS